MYRKKTVKQFRRIFLFMFVGMIAQSLHSEQNQKLTSFYLKPRIITLGSQFRASDILNWKDDVNPVLYEGLTAPLRLTPNAVKDLLVSAYQRQTGNSIEFEINGNDSILIPLSGIWGKEKLEQSLLQYLKKEIQLDEDNFRIYLESKPVSLPEKNVEIVWRKVGRGIHAGKRIFPLDVFFEGKLIYSIPVGFLIEEKKLAWFTKRNIEPKEILQEYDVEKKVFFTTDNHTEYDLENPIGKTALNAIPEGVALQRKQTRRLNMIERGSEVNLVYTTGNIMLKVRTRALASGNEGDEIDLLNLSSNRRLKGKIQSAGICLLENAR